MIYYQNAKSKDLTLKTKKEKLIACAKEILDKSLKLNRKISPERESSLRSLVKGICPVCNSQLEVISVESNGDSFCFNYICGHHYEGTTDSDVATTK